MIVLAVAASGQAFEAGLSLRYPASRRFRGVGGSASRPLLRSTGSMEISPLVIRAEKTPKGRPPAALKVVLQCEH
jgi:hypothetical protein